MQLQALAELLRNNPVLIGIFCGAIGAVIGSIFTLVKLI